VKEHTDCDRTFFETRDILRFFGHGLSAGRRRHFLQSNRELLTNTHAQDRNWDPSVVKKGF
jgi:hypothetical protein